MSNADSNNERPPPRVFEIPREVWDNILGFTDGEQTLLELMHFGVPRAREAAVQRRWIHYAVVTAENIQEVERHAPIIESLTIRDPRVLDTIGRIKFPQLGLLRLEGLDRFPSVMNLGENLKTLQLIDCEDIELGDQIIIESPWVGARVFTEKLQVFQITRRVSATISLPELLFFFSRSKQATLLYV